MSEFIETRKGKKWQTKKLVKTSWGVDQKRNKPRRKKKKGGKGTVVNGNNGGNKELNHKGQLWQRMKVFTSLWWVDKNKQIDTDMYDWVIIE